MKEALKFWDNYPEFYTEGHGPHSRPMMLYLIAKREYYLGRPIMTDVVFDAFEVAIRSRYPECPALLVVGVPSNEDISSVANWAYEERKREKA